MEEVQSGLRLLCYLASLSDDANIWISELSVAELIHSEIERQTYWYLLKKGLGFSARKPFRGVATGYPFTAIISTPAKESNAVKGIRGFIVHLGTEILEKPLDYVENQENSVRQAAAIFAALIENVMVEVIDGLLYSYAVAVQAEAFLTSDNRLRAAVEYLRQGGPGTADVRWIEARDAVKKRVSTVCGWDASKIVLPRACSGSSERTVFRTERVCHPGWYWSGAG
jgi:hypothetical protein